jgi:hypothetical protein
MVTTGRFTNTIKPFSVSFQPLLNQIETKEKTLKKLATMATMEGVRGEHSPNEIWLQEDLIGSLNRYSPKDRHSRRNEGSFRSDFG